MSGEAAKCRVALLFLETTKDGHALAVFIMLLASLLELPTRVSMLLSISMLVLLLLLAHCVYIAT